MPLLEDVDLVCRLRKLGPPALVRQPITTSARRWQRLGFLQTTIINQVHHLDEVLMAAYAQHLSIIGMKFGHMSQHSCLALSYNEALLADIPCHFPQLQVYGISQLCLWAFS